MPTRLSLDSADDQIDSFILKFEKDSIGKEKEAVSLNESLESLSLKFLLEQEEEEFEEEEFEEEEPPDTGGDDTEEGTDDEVDDPDPADSADVSQDIQPLEKMPKPPLDVDSFAKRVARLAMNYETLIDMKSIIVNRALNFLSENYDKEHLDEMKEILNTQFDFDLDDGREVPPAPFAVGANPAGAGLGGGGA